MIIKIDFNSDEALYIQLRNQIIVGIATDAIREGDVLPSVRSLADTIGINMHTVNKAYSVLRQEGFVKLDRRRGAVIAVDFDKIRAMEELMSGMQVLLAKAACQNISRREVHELVDSIMDRFECACGGKGFQDPGEDTE
ncbi:MAG: GntR family transcriptional regulator [Lachnospiraceae bacterium]|nr:GntR family transcriptional regulator [Lachnospiraceae bacterium]